MSNSRSAAPFSAALTIAGSDPSGGAGIQADIKTFTTLGVYCCAVISCHTVQNSQGVRRIQPADPMLLADQLHSLAVDMPISHVKIGMLGSREVARSVVHFLDDFAGIVFYDPVLRSSTNDALAEEGLFDFVMENFLSQIDVLSPNREELSLLAKRQINTIAEGIEAAEALLDRFSRLQAVVVKGGHFDEGGGVTDTLVHRDEVRQKMRTIDCAHQRIQTRNNHGTGCTFASAFCAYHLRSGNLLEAFQQASEYVATLLDISRNFVMGQGHGGLYHGLYHNADRRR